MYNFKLSFDTENLQSHVIKHCMWPDTRYPVIIHEWYDDNKQLHREDGSALINLSNKSYHQFRHGKLHREVGPAVMYNDGSVDWYFDGIRVTDEIEDWMKENVISWPFNNENLMLFKLQWL